MNKKIVTALKLYLIQKSENESFARVVVAGILYKIRSDIRRNL